MDCPAVEAVWVWFVAPIQIPEDPPVELDAPPEAKVTFVVMLWVWVSVPARVKRLEEASLISLS
jgi:hypothetical protein